MDSENQMVLEGENTREQMGEGFKWAATKLRDGFHLFWIQKKITLSKTIRMHLTEYRKEN